MLIASQSSVEMRSRTVRALSRAFAIDETMEPPFSSSSTRNSLTGPSEHSMLRASNG